MKWVDSLKGHADSHYLYYALSYLMVFPLLLKPITICQATIPGGGLAIVLLAVGNFMILSASGLKRFRYHARYAESLLIVGGILLDVVCYASLLYYECRASGYLILPILVSCWLVFLNFAEISDQDRKRGNHFVRSVLICFIFVAIAFYLAIWHLGNQFMVEFEEITSRGSLFAENGFDYKQISILVGKARMKSALQMAVAAFLHMGLFFILFRRLRKK